MWLCAHSRNEAVLESAAAALGNLAYYNDINRIKVCLPLLSVIHKPVSLE